MEKFEKFMGSLKELVYARVFMKEWVGVPRMGLVIKGMGGMKGRMNEKKE